MNLTASHPHLDFLFPEATRDARISTSRWLEESQNLDLDWDISPTAALTQIWDAFQELQESDPDHFQEEGQDPKGTCLRLLKPVYGQTKKLERKVRKLQNMMWSRVQEIQLALVEASFFNEVSDYDPDNSTPVHSKVDGSTSKTKIEPEPESADNLSVSVSSVGVGKHQRKPKRGVMTSVWKFMTCQRSKGKGQGQMKDGEELPELAPELELQSSLPATPAEVILKTSTGSQPQFIPMPTVHEQNPNLHLDLDTKAAKSQIHSELQNANLFEKITEIKEPWLKISMAEEPSNSDPIPSTSPPQDPVTCFKAALKDLRTLVTQVTHDLCLTELTFLDPPLTTIGSNPEDELTYAYAVNTIQAEYAAEGVWLLTDTYIKGFEAFKAFDRFCKVIGGDLEFLGRMIESFKKNRSGESAEKEPLPLYRFPVVPTKMPRVKSNIA